MTETLIRVQVAPGETVSITPHPSGLAELGALYIRAGEHVSVTKARADELYGAGKILHPISGQPRPAQAFTPPPLVSRSAETFEFLAARADAERTLETAVPSRRSSAVDGWRDHVNIEPHDPSTAEQIINVGERRWQW